MYPLEKFGKQIDNWPLACDWNDMYALQGAEVDFGTIAVPTKPDGAVVPILNAVEVHPDEKNRFFKRMMRWYGIVCFIAPGTLAGVDYTFSSITGEDVRSAQKDGSYVYWARDHVKLSKKGKLKFRSGHASFDTAMTVEEALLYHLFQLRRYGREYLALHYSYGHRCLGSKGRNYIRWDLQDIKICLD